MKRGLLRHQILKVSGKIAISNPGYLCSFYNDEGQQSWVYWGIITDKNIKEVKVDSKDMKIVNAGSYSYRIGWLMGTGKEPQNNIEEIKVK